MAPIKQAHPAGSRKRLTANKSKAKGKGDGDGGRDVASSPGGMDGLHMLAISSQMPSEDGFDTQQDWVSSIRKQAHEKHRKAAEKVIQSFKLEEAKLAQQQADIVREEQEKYDAAKTAFISTFQTNNKLIANLLSQLHQHHLAIGRYAADRSATVTVKVEKTGEQAERAKQGIQSVIIKEEAIGDNALVSMEQAAEQRMASGTAKAKERTATGRTNGTGVKKGRKTDDTLVASDRDE